MRGELIELEEVGIWNEWVKNLRGKVLEGKLGGDRKELWREVGRNRVGLVESKEVEIGGGSAGVGEEEARKVSFFLFNSSCKKKKFIPCGFCFLKFCWTHFPPASFSLFFSLLSLSLLKSLHTDSNIVPIHPMKHFFEISSNSFENRLPSFPAYISTYLCSNHSLF